MSRERDAIEEIWKWLQKTKDHYDEHFTESEYSYHYGHIEEILTQMEDLIQEDLTIMESSCRSRATLKTALPKPPGNLSNVTCPLVERISRPTPPDVEAKDLDLFSPQSGPPPYTFI